MAGTMKDWLEEMLGEPLEPRSEPLCDALSPPSLLPVDNYLSKKKRRGRHSHSEASMKVETEEVVVVRIDSAEHERILREAIQEMYRRRELVGEQDGHAPNGSQEVQVTFISAGDTEVDVEVRYAKL